MNKFSKISKDITLNESTLNESKTKIDRNVLSYLFDEKILLSSNLPIDPIVYNGIRIHGKEELIDSIIHYIDNGTIQRKKYDKTIEQLVKDFNKINSAKTLLERAITYGQEINENLELRSVFNEKMNELLKYE